MSATLVFLILLALWAAAIIGAGRSVRGADLDEIPD
jgi:hypothetical protein